MLSTWPETKPRAWLPEAALTDGTLSSAVDETMARWSAHWFARKDPRPLGDLVPAAADYDGNEARWRVLDGELAFSVEEGAELELAGLMLDAPTGAALTAADRKVMSAVFGAAADDLCRRLAEAFGLPASSTWRTATRLPGDFVHDALGCCFGLDPDAPQIRLLVAGERAVARRKSDVPAERRMALGRLDDAFARQCVAVSAHLGRCGLALSEFAELRVGDVALLDGDPSGRLRLVVDRNITSGTCAIVEKNGAYELQIIEPIGRT